MKSIGLQPSTTGAVGGKETGQHVTHYIIPGGPFSKAFEKLAAKGWKLNLQSALASGPNGGNNSKTKFLPFVRPERLGQTRTGDPLHSMRRPDDGGCSIVRSTTPGFRGHYCARRYGSYHGGHHDAPACAYSSHGRTLAACCTGDWPPEMRALSGEAAAVRKHPEMREAVAVGAITSPFRSDVTYRQRRSEVKKSPSDEEMTH